MAKDDVDTSVVVVLFGLLLFSAVCVAVALSVDSCAVERIGVLDTPAVLLGFGAYNCAAIPVLLLALFFYRSEAHREKAYTAAALLCIISGLLYSVWMVITFFVLFEKNNVECLGTGDVASIFTVIALLPEMMVTFFFVTYGTQRNNTVDTAA